MNLAEKQLGCAIVRIALEYSSQEFLCSTQITIVVGNPCFSHRRSYVLGCNLTQSGDVYAGDVRSAQIDVRRHGPIQSKHLEIAVSGCAGNFTRLVVGACGLTKISRQSEDLAKKTPCEGIVRIAFN